MAFGFGVGIQRLGSVGVPTLAALNALPAPGSGIRPTGFVYADPTVSNNGVYTWNGTGWSKSRGLPDQVAKLTVTGGTANAIVATAQPGVDPATTLMVLLTPSASNTGAVTLNGKPVKSRVGADLASGALTAGALYALVDLGTEYRVFLNNFADIADISGLQATLDSKADAAALSEKSNVGHVHSVSDVTGLAQAISDAFPVGTVFHFAGSTPPAGTLKANGAAISRSAYAALFAAIGTTHGAGDGSTTFNLPDLRGVFLRAFDDGRGIDPSRVFGSLQSSQNLSHSHSVSDPGHSHGGYTSNSGNHQHGVPLSGGSFLGAAGAGLRPQDTPLGSTTLTTVAGDHNHSVQTYASGTGIGLFADGGSEARPTNVALLACIKY